MNEPNDNPETESEQEEQVKIPGARLLSNGALIPINEGNKHILKRKDLVPTELTYDEDGKLCEVVGADAVSTIILSGSLKLMSKALRDVEIQTENLVASISKVPGGADFLESKGYEPIVVENIADPEARSLEDADDVQARTEREQAERIEAKRLRNQEQQEVRNAELEAQRQLEEEQEMEERANREAQESRDAIEAKELEELERQTNPDNDNPGPPTEL